MWLYIQQTTLRVLGASEDHRVRICCNVHKLAHTTESHIRPQGREQKYALVEWPPVQPLQVSTPRTFSTRPNGKL